MGVRSISGLGLSLALLLAACAPNSTGPAKTVDTSRLVVAVQSMSQDWTPWLAGAATEPVIYAIGETLTRVNRQTGALEGGLAESWSVTPDGTWTFKLRPNIPFQDGYGNVTAEDVKFSWEQAINKDTKLTNAGVYRQAIDSDMKNFEIVSPLEFKLKTSKPLVFLPTVIADYPRGLLIQSKKYWADNPEKAIVHPHGTGPYKFVSSTLGIEVQLEAVPNHYRQTSTYKAVTFKIIPDDAAIMAAVASGAVDLAPIAPRLLNEAKANKIASKSIPDTTNWYLIPGGWYVGDPNYDPKAPWIQADSPEKGLAIRQAISLAIDRQTIVNKVLAGEGAISRGPYWEYPSNPLTVDPSWPIPAFDLAKARQLLAQGGYPNGFPVTAPIYDRPDKAGMLDINEALAGSFEALGLKVNRLVVDYSGVIQPAVRAKKTTGWLYQWGSQPQEPITSLINFATLTTGTPRLVHPTFTDALAKMTPEWDREKRYKLQRDVTSAAIKDLLLIPLFVTHTPFLTTDKVGTWTPIPGLSQISGLETIKPK
jgi:peptide/nickel transport system substrate-binding protein